VLRLARGVTIRSHVRTRASAVVMHNVPKGTATVSNPATLRKFVA
jgi:hypothetical protein